MDTIEHLRVVERASLAKFYVSATYKQVKMKFWRALLQNVLSTKAREEREANEFQEDENETHTHTHTQAKKISRAGGITTDGEDDGDEGQDAQGSTESGEDCEDNEDSESSEDEGHSEGGSVSDCTSDDCSDDGE